MLRNSAKTPAAAHSRRCAVAHASNPDEVSDGDHSAADDKQEPCARDQVRNDQKHQPAKQRHDGALLPSVHEEPQPDRAKEKTQKQRRSSYLGHTRRYPAGQGRDAFIASAATVCCASICDTAAHNPLALRIRASVRGWYCLGAGGYRPPVSRRALRWLEHRGRRRQFQAWVYRRGC